jgi:hypothetical protein
MVQRRAFLRKDARGRMAKIVEVKVDQAGGYVADRSNADLTPDCV